MGDLWMLEGLVSGYPVLRDEYGAYHCPMASLVSSFTDDDEEHLEKALCGEELAVIWTLYCQVPTHDNDREPSLMPAAEASRWADGAHWELKCGAGHVLATSIDGSSGESSHDFDSRDWFA